MHSDRAGAICKILITHHANSKKPEKTNTINLAEFGTYTLEFTRLSQITKDNTYAKLANKLVEDAISHPSVMPGLYPTHWDISGDTMKPIKSSECVTHTHGSFFITQVFCYRHRDRGSWW